MQKYGIRVNRGRIATHQGIGRNEKGHPRGRPFSYPILKDSV